MADANDTAAILAQLNDEFNRLGYVTDATMNRMQDAATGIQDFKKKLDLSTKSATSFAEAGMEAATAMHAGAKGSQAFNSSLDKMRESVEATGALLTAIIPGGPVVKAFIAATTLATGKLFELQKTAGKMSDDLFKGFQGLSRSGAAASDGMTGLQEGMRKLGLGVQDMESYTRLIGESSKDLALFKGSVFAGRRAFEDIGQEMKQYNYQLRAAGMNQEDINAGTMAYLKLQTRLGQAQNMTTQQLADGAKKYLIEQDALTKLTGQSREQAEKQAQDALMEEAYAAKVRQLQLEGNTEAVEKLRMMNQFYAEFGGPGMAKGFRANVTGMLTNADALKYNMGSNMEMMRTTQAVIAGQMDYKEALNLTGKAFRQNVDALGTTLGQVEVYGDTFGSLYEANQFAFAAEQNFVKQMGQITEDQKNAGITGVKSAESLTDANIRLAQAQQKAMIDLQETTGRMMLGAVEANIKLAEAGNKMDAIYEKLVPIMTKFSELLGELVTNVLPPLIDGLTRLLNLIPGLGPDTAAAESERLNTGAGVLGGAAVGAAIGSVVPVIGTAVGAAVGGVLGGYAGNKFGLGTVLGTSEEMMTGAFEGRAAGGPVNANTPYIVGEKGPELFMPKEAGEIISTKQLLGSSKPAGMPDVDIEYRKIVAAIKDITMDVGERRQLEDRFTRDVKKFTEHNKQYQDSMISLLDQDLTNTKTYMEAGGTPGALGSMASSGQGMQPGGGMGMTPGGSLSGLKIKKGDVHEEGSALSPQLVQLARSIQENMPNFNYFSAFNDRFHQEKASSSSHTRGTALDFTLKKPPTPEEGQEIVRYLRSMGASLVIDEYNNPSSNATAGHIHAQIPGFADGGIAMDPTIAMVAEKGPEAMIPLTNDGFLGKLSSVMSALVPQQQQMISLLEDIRRSQQTTASASERMAAVASN